MNIILNNNKLESLVIGGTGPMGPMGYLSSSPDVDTTSLQDGSVLVYKSLTHKWTSSTLLNLQNVDGGEF
jgi:hypothetical protein